MSIGIVLTVNVGSAEPNPAKAVGVTGIGKRPIDHAITVRPPGEKTTGLHSGVVGDYIGDVEHHGGDDQAVYAYAREDYAWWESELGRELPNGLFGENLTTEGLDLVGAVIGERWTFPSGVVLQPTFGRIPCATFQHRMGEQRWTKWFALANRTGAYLRILEPGEIRAGDRVEVTERPGHGLTVAEAFDIYMHDPSRLSRLLVADSLPPSARREIEERLSRTTGTAR
ncbi:MOSC domain-containing protein YiiM [Actinoplanes lutulentus]|uniref:MOSC domain-containing protein YiiM n=1 Tax=Actinoplanes lutulentus TaxID=1287878 RepID=A0A327ZHA2_9ACTN|nr:MOSC domain-containing protein YiiM [Actinoplanes lutulentus]RAK40536.1 MOSC domain-containing protein YiiM [Actinoplanes lutulentus]